MMCRSDTSHATMRQTMERCFKSSRVVTNSKPEPHLMLSVVKSGMYSDLGPLTTHIKLFCTDASHISSTWPLKRSYLPAARPNIILEILRTTLSLRMWGQVTGMRLVSSEPSASRYVSRHYFTLPFLCVEQARSSSQRKQLFKNLQERINMRPRQLLLDMKVRWSSTYVMLTRAESRRQVSRICDSRAT